MNDNNNRRDVLKLIATSSVASTGFSSLSGATDNGDNRQDKPHLLPYDLRVRNLGSEIVTTVVTIRDSSTKSKRVSHKSSQLSKEKRQEDRGVSIDGGSYRIQAKVMFKGEPVATAEKELTFPPGGIPDYAGIDVDVYGTDKVKIRQKKV